MSIHFFDGNTGETYRYSNGKLEKIEQRDIPAPAPQGDERSGAGSSDPLRSKLAAEIDAGMPALFALERERAHSRAWWEGVEDRVWGTPSQDVDARITAAVMAEREACAAICDKASKNAADAGDKPSAADMSLCASWIRSRPAPVAQAAETNNVDGGGSSTVRAPDCDSGDGGSIPLHHTTIKADSALLEKAAQAIYDEPGWAPAPAEVRETVAEGIARAAAKAFGIEVGE